MPATFCPLIKADCKEHACKWYAHILGADPQTGAQVDKWACVVEFVPMLMLEQTQQLRQAGAAMESLRNENVTLGQSLVGAVTLAATEAHNRALPERAVG